MNPAQAFAERHRRSTAAIRIVSVLLCVMVSAAALGSAVGSRPDVVVVVADDLGWGDLSANGNVNLQTPALDRLAAEGASFSAFTVQPVCAPTRAELLTGRYAARDGVRGVSEGAERLDAATPTIANAFREAGYATAALGKWHNGTQAPWHPMCRGFDSFYGFTSGHWADYFDPLLDRDGRLTNGRGYLPDALTDEAIRLLAERSDQPQFVWLAFNTPHSPMQVPDRWWERHANQALRLRGTKPEREDVPHTRAALAMVENLDHNVGRLIDAIDRSGRRDQTVVVFLSDNGPNGHRFNSGLRGVKGSTDFGGVRSPLLVRWPGVIDAGRAISTPAAAIDVGPTLAELVGVPQLDGSRRDGVSLANALRGDEPPPVDRTLFANWTDRVSARRGDWFLDGRGRLYDLSRDPEQRREVASANPAIAARLRQEVVAHRRETGLDRPPALKPFDVGADGLEVTQLPIRDATLTGGVRRSNRYPNATYVTNWRSGEDRIAWPVRVVSPGRYRVRLWRTCRAGDVGARIELGFAGARLATTLTEPHDPPLEAAVRDRVPRKEGNMKRFEPVTLGEITLPSAEGSLSLRAIDKPGESVADVRLLELERLD